MPHLPDRHTTHDLALVAAFAADDATGADRELASSLVRDCADCARVATDLQTLALAIAALPAPRRRRDYRLTADQAARFRPIGIRRWLAAFAGRRFALAMPLGGSLATLGLVALLVTAVPGPLIAGSEPADRFIASGEDYESISAPPSVWAIPGQGGGGAQMTGGEIIPEGDIDLGPGPNLFDEAVAEITQARGVDEVVVILAGASILVGLALITLRWSARRAF